MGRSSTRPSSSAIGGEIWAWAHEDFWDLNTLSLSSLSLSSLSSLSSWGFCLLSYSLWIVTFRFMLLQSSLSLISFSEIKTWNRVASRIRGNAFSDLQLFPAFNKRLSITYRCTHIDSLDWQCWHEHMFRFYQLAFHKMIWKSQKIAIKKKMGKHKKL